MVGTTISHYKVLEKIGEGGMGEVYRATDTKLNRDVALKILPQQFASDSQRMARFQREAEVLASLDHPNIGQIYGIEEAGATKALVLQLIEGPTLAERIAQGPIPVEDALKIALQMAEGLEAAHEKGVIHRDLKPANIKITPEGQVKILDFGLAKAFAEDQTDVSLSNSPTISMAATQQGVILGTAAYMSPEQTSGLAVDKRTDVWAFGVVLFEMLTGQGLFEGETVAHVLASVLKTEPDWKALPSDTAAPVQRLLRRCLERDRKERLHDIADARLELRDALTVTSEPLPEAAGTPRLSTSSMIPWVLTAVLAIAVVTLLWQSIFRDEPTTAGSLAHFEIDLPQLSPIGNIISLSPDGRHLVYIGRGENGYDALYHRSLDEVRTRELPGTEGATFPFFSPDARWVGFHAQGELRKIPLAGGRPEDICETPDVWGASWGTDGNIVFGTPFGGLFRVPETGGEPIPLTTPDIDSGETSHNWPTILPDGETVLFTIWRTSDDDAQIGSLSLKSGAWDSLIQGFYPRYSPSGHLLFARTSTIMAVPFNLGERQVTSQPVTLFEEMQTDILGVAAFDVSRNGRLGFLTNRDPLANSTLVWVDRNGILEPVWEEQEAGYVMPVFSRDGQRLAFARKVGQIFRVCSSNLVSRRPFPVNLDPNSHSNKRAGSAPHPSPKTVPRPAG